MTLNIEEAATRIGESPERIRKALNYLADLGDLRLRPSGLRHGYRLAPDEPREVGPIAARLQELFARREEGEAGRLGLVIDLCETGECLTRHLLRHFGEALETDCGSCDNCLDPGSNSGGRSLPFSLDDDITADQVAAMQAVAGENHSALRQPRQLARFFCGITSPAATRARLSRHDAFGLLAEVPFQTVLTQAEEMLMG